MEILSAILPFNGILRFFNNPPTYTSLDTLFPQVWLRVKDTAKSFWFQELKYRDAEFSEF